jgi:hypothetical protein
MYLQKHEVLLDLTLTCFYSGPDGETVINLNGFV